MMIVVVVVVMVMVMITMMLIFIFQLSEKSLKMHSELKKLKADFSDSLNSEKVRVYTSMYRM